MSGFGRVAREAMVKCWLWRAGSRLLSNRRKTPMAAFQTLLGLGTRHAPTPYTQIRRARDLAKARDDRHPNI